MSEIHELEAKARAGWELAHAAENELQLAKKALADQKEREAVERFLQSSKWNKGYRESIAFHYDVRACIGDYLGFDGHKPSLGETNLSQTVSALARWISEITGEKWERH